MGIFSKLFKFVTGRGGKAEPVLASPKAERIRQTAADEHAERAARARKQDAQIAESLADIKAKIARESASILESLGKREQAAFEIDLARRWEETARKEQELLNTPQGQFLAGMLILTYGRDFTSSNPPAPAVNSVWYVPSAQEIFVRFFVNDHGRRWPGPTYKYWPINESEALEMYRAVSKGIYIWDAYRIRGTKLGHKKSYAKVAG